MLPADPITLLPDDSHQDLFDHYPDLVSNCLTIIASREFLFVGPTVAIARHLRLFSPACFLAMATARARDPFLIDPLPAWTEHLGTNSTNEAGWQHSTDW